MALVGLTFAVAFAAFWTLYFRYPSLQDTDSYYHLAMAREIARDGVPDTLPWARMTAMHEAFGDPVLLFHAALAPFASGEHPEHRVLLALAGFDAALFAALAALGIAAIGRWGALLPWVIYLGSTEALSRLTRLRPELLALLLLLAAAWFAGRGAYRRLGLVAALYALSYSAIHAFAGLMFAAFLLFAWRGGRGPGASTRWGRWEWALPLYTVCGLGLGLVLHPSFPANVPRLVDAARIGLGGAAIAGSGAELGPHSLKIALFTQLGCLVAALVIWWARRPSDERTTDDAAGDMHDLPTRDVMVLFAIAFGLLYALAARFISFALPFAGLALLWSLRARGEFVDKTFAFFGRRVSTALGLSVAALLAIPPLAIQAPRFAAKASAGPDGLRAAESRALAAKLPPGARVAATWGTTDRFVFFAPHAQYLEVLDPTPMATYAPTAAAASQRVFGGGDEDPPFTVATVLESEYVLAPRFTTEPGIGRLLSQLAADPRVEVLHDQIYFLARVLPGRNQPFVLDWKARPEPSSAWGSAEPPGLSSATAVSSAVASATLLYPRPSDPAARAIEGYVDLRRLAPMAPMGATSPCWALWTDVPIPPEIQRLNWRFAPAGPSELWWDGSLLARSPGTGPARLDESIEGVVSTTSGSSGASGARRLAVRSCAPEPRGFYLLLFVEPSR